MGKIKPPKSDFLWITRDFLTAKIVGSFVVRLLKWFDRYNGRTLYLVVIFARNTLFSGYFMIRLLYTQRRGR